MTKTCTSCGKRKGTDEFYERGDGAGHRQPCIACCYEIRRKACVSCGLEFLPEGRHASRCSDCYPIYRQAAKLFSAAQHRAKKNGLAFDLTISWIEERLRLPCPKTGRAFKLNEGTPTMDRRGPWGPSLDQRSPRGWYTQDNVQVVCWWYNVSKQQFTDDEVLELCTTVVATASSSDTRLARSAGLQTTLRDTATDTPGASPPAAVTTSPLRGDRSPSAERGAPA